MAIYHGAQGSSSGLSASVCSLQPRTSLSHPDTLPSPPHRTVREVLPHTALQCPSSGRMRRFPLRGLHSDERPPAHGATTSSTVFSSHALSACAACWRIVQGALGRI